MNNRLIKKEVTQFLKTNSKLIVRHWSLSIFNVPGYQKDRAIIPRRVHESGMSAIIKSFATDIENPRVKSCEFIIKKLVFKDYLSASSAADTIQGLMILRAILVEMLSDKYADEPKKRKIAVNIIVNQIDCAIICFSGIYKKKDFAKLETIMKYGKKLITVNNQDKLYGLIIEAAVIESDSDRASLMLMEKDGFLHIKSSVGIPKKIVANTRVRLGEGIAGRVAKTAKPIIINKGYKIPVYMKRLLRGLGLKSSISIPLMADSTVLGVLNLAKRRNKPFFDKEDVELLSILAYEAGTAISNCRLFEEVHALYEGTIVSLAAAIDARDHYTHGHSRRVAKIALVLAKRLKLSEDAIEKTRLSSMLHDIGKIGVPDKILLKPGKLTDKEWEIIRKHPLYAVAILKHLPRLKHIIPIVYHEHERYDGKGYMEGLKGKQIPIESRIIAVADAYEAMTSNRPYRKAMRKEKAIKEIKINSGTQFDPVVVKIFLKAVNKSF
jgi:response regulator RpfG family c-di-GMP phosphodiesterase